MQRAGEDYSRGRAQLVQSHYGGRGLVVKVQKERWSGMGELGVPQKMRSERKAGARSWGPP